jgi:hypothetical protein
VPLCVGVVVPILQVHLVEMCVCVARLTVKMLMLDVVVGMTGVRVGVGGLAVIMLVIVRGIVPMG